MVQSSLTKGPGQSPLRASSDHPSTTSQHSENPVVQYIIAPISRNIFKTLLALFTFFILYHWNCSYWSSSAICDRQVNHLITLAEVVFVVLMGYTYYLRQH